MTNLSLLNDTDLLSLLRCGYESLLEDVEEINLLNVFPVPDGDTGTNMRITYEKGLVECEGKKGIPAICEAFSRGALFGARGNSGVLLSEYFKGFGLALKDKETVSVSDFALGMGKGYQQAYEATVSPAEGTILTVAREAYMAVKEKLNDLRTFEDLFTLLIPAMAKSLDNTPNLLECLREAGVIDSGGKGLLSIYEGYAEFVLGKRSAEAISFSSRHPTRIDTDVDFSAFTENSVLDYGYCTEFLLQLLNSKTDVKRFDIDAFTQKLNSLGDSLIVTKHDTVVKVHIHTKRPYEPMAYALGFGEFLTIKIENMALQHNTVEKRKNLAKYDVIAIANGDGIKSTLESLGKVRVLDGGDTMNTSVGEILEALESNPSKEAILMPNNKNIFLSAKAAVEQYKGGKVYLVPSSSIQECYMALSMVLLPGKPLEIIAAEMEEFISCIHSASVAQSSRDCHINGVNSSKAEYLAMIDGEIVSSSASREEAFMKMLSSIPSIDSLEIVFAFYGSAVDEEEIERLKERVSKAYPCLEIGFLEGKQKIYDYLVGYPE